jgi:tRNA-specific 2-thiouridylase
MKPQGKKVFVGMSGGVDSSVSAALLQKAGYDVTGVFIKVWSPDWLPCPWKEERRDAMRVAAHLGIPFITLDFEAEYKKAVVDYLLDEYKAGRTPNPDIMCNRDIKFGSFMKAAREMGADYIATGHYAQVKDVGNDFHMYEGADKNKDQSYFLWTLGQNELSHTLFPVGHLEKSDVRKLAQKFGLPTAEKKDSQGICFLGPVDMKDFLQHYIPMNPGNVVDENGAIVGHHDGAIFYTVGERHGFTSIHKGSHNEPYYIIGKNVKDNILVVSHKENPDSLRTTKAVTLSSIVWNSSTPDPSKTYLARFRYRQTPIECQVNGDTVTFTQRQAGVSLGQSVVVYDKEQCLGGGIIDIIK